MKKNLLLVGENPFGGTGNGNMMQAITGAIDLNKYNISCFCRGPMPDEALDPLMPIPVRIISASESDTGDSWGKAKLLNLLKNEDRFDLVLFIGIDIWTYSSIFYYFKQFQKAGKKFKTAAIFPYDSSYIRKDLIESINMIDFPLVYSFYGYETIKHLCPNLLYFRPTLLNKDVFHRLDEDVRLQFRRDTFQNCKDDDILVGFVGNNQFRKCPQVLIEAFSIARKENEKLHLYMHTDLEGGVFNLKQTMKDFDLSTGYVHSKIEGLKYHPEHMNILYNCFDMLVNCTSQEGLSWTPIEAALAGTPVILSESTAHKDLWPNLRMSKTFFVDCVCPYWIPGGVGNSTKTTFMRANSPHPRDVSDAILHVAGKLNEDWLTEIKDRQGLFADRWVQGASDINHTLDSILLPQKIEVVSKRGDVLFVQHSAAGDILMTTQCFKGIKERHPNKKLVYMTQDKFFGVIQGNPYIDEVISWDIEKMKEFSVVYNPHGERILPGGFNNLDDTLYSMYPYFCKVEPDKMFINVEEPECSHMLEDCDYVVIQTSGGDKVYRTYKYMDTVLQFITDVKFVQLGSANDKSVNHPECIDLRGKLSFTESAWVMKNAKAALLIDSFPAHLAGALGTPSVVLFGPAPARVTRPRDDYNVITCLEPNKKDVCPNLTSCWGEPNRKSCQSPCINTINPITIAQELTKKIKGE